MLSKLISIGIPKAFWHISQSLLLLVGAQGPIHTMVLKTILNRTKSPIHTCPVKIRLRTLLILVKQWRVAMEASKQVADGSGSFGTSFCRQEKLWTELSAVGKALDKAFVDKESSRWSFRGQRKLWMMVDGGRSFIWNWIILSGGRPVCIGPMVDRILKLWFTPNNGTWFCYMWAQVLRSTPS